MNTKYLDILEYYKIIEILGNYCKTYIGKENLNLLMPSFDSSHVLHLLSETQEAVNLIIRKSNIPLSEIPDVTLWLKSLESNSTLSAKALLEISYILKLSRQLKEYFFSDKSFNISDFPILSDFFSLFYTNKGIEEKIFDVIIDENTISDDASDNLKNIRKKQRHIEQNIKSSLNNILHSYSKYIQENVVTIRNDRYVIPVKEEYRSQIKGFVHDVSSTGSTVFIEPLSIFELNNDLNNLKIEEKIEIEKIIKDLSNLFVPYIENLSTTLENIGLLDFLFAKAKYSKSILRCNANY